MISSKYIYILTILLTLVGCKNANDLVDNRESNEDSIIDSYKFPRNHLKSFPNRFKLTAYEARLILKDSSKYWQKYLQIAQERWRKDSIKFYGRKDSLSKIVHPVDKSIPFGSGNLKQLMSGKSKEILLKISFDNEKISDSISLLKSDIFKIWTYYLKLHPYVDANLTEKFVEKRLPTTKTFELIKIDKNSSLTTKFGEASEYYFDPKFGEFQIRLQNIFDFEVYYTTTGRYSSLNGCGIHYKTEENCCFSFTGYDCNSTGYLILYEKTKQHSIIIPVFEMKTEGDGGLTSFRFFYLDEDFKIHLFDGYSGMTDYSYSARKYQSNTIRIVKSYEVPIQKKGVGNITELNRKLD